MRRSAFPSPGGDWCHFYSGLLLLAGAFMRRSAFQSPGGDWCDFYSGLLLLAGAFMRRSAFPVPWRGLVSFLRRRLLLSESLVCGCRFQSPGGDWCHFYTKAACWSVSPIPTPCFSPLAGIGVISTCHRILNPVARAAISVP
jgi:hypothetical protein